MTAGTVILYNPDDDVYSNVLSYLGQVQHLYVVDNSTTINSQVIDKLLSIENISYINNGGNQGIAHALNVAARNAIEDGYDFLLTMDQDTYLGSNYVSSLLEAVAHFPQDQIGIISPNYSVRPVDPKHKIQKILITMTSGTVLNLTVYRQIGPFLEKLFIDHVDHEYCLRINKCGYSVLQVNDMRIEHRPGQLHAFQFLSMRCTFSSHSPVRLYYFVRNGFYVSTLYKSSFPEFRKLYWRHFLKELVKIWFLKNKLSYLRALVRGLKDCKSNRLGKYPYDNIKDT